MYASPNLSSGSSKIPSSAARVAKRTATGVPVPSPNVYVAPREVVTVKVPRWINRPSKNRSNRSIGRPHHS